MTSRRFDGDSHHGQTFARDASAGDVAELTQSLRRVFDALSDVRDLARRADDPCRATLLEQLALVQDAIDQVRHAAEAAGRDGDPYEQSLLSRRDRGARRVDSVRLDAAAIEQLRRTNDILEEQLVRSGRVEADLFALKARLEKIEKSLGQASRAPRPAKPRPSETAPPPRLPSWYRKLRKLRRDPKQFFADSRVPGLRALGKALAR